MKIVKIIGGLGNQMFQFALYTALRKQFPKERVLVDLHCFNGYHKHQGFEIPRVFDVTYEKANWKEVAKVAYPYPNFQSWRIGSRILPCRKTMLQERTDKAFEPTVLTRESDTYYDGYWQHEDYFSDIREDILQTFHFPIFEDERNQETGSRLTDNNSCAIHIRRGDYVTDKLFRGICDIEYYRTAIKRIKDVANPDVFCIFSDDVEWCRKHLADLLRQTSTIYVNWNRGDNSFRDMHLMSLCHHQIIANSSFSWWGAWLNTNKDKIIIAPQKWWNTNGAHTPISKSWIII